MSRNIKNRIYAIGDIHGELELLRAAVAMVEQDGGADARIVFLGDYIDRGPDSRRVIQFLIDGQEEGKDWIFLLGNHDRMMTMFLEDYPRNDERFPVGFHWLHERIGGVETLASYDIEIGERERVYQLHKRVRAAVPQTHQRFLETLRYYHCEGELLFVHAGIMPGVSLHQQDRDDLIWIREEFHNDTREHPWLVVHGHTPVDKARHYGNRVNLDTGCGYGNALTAAVFEGRDCWLLTDQGRVRLLQEPYGKWRRKNEICR